MMLNQKQNEVRLKTSYIAIAFAFLFIFFTAIIGVTNIQRSKEYGWIVVIAIVTLFALYPTLIVAYKISASKSHFILCFRTGKQISVPKAGLTSIDQAWIRFRSNGISSHTFGTLWLRNLDEVNKFIKKNIHT